MKRHAAMETLLKLATSPDPDIQESRHRCDGDPQPSRSGSAQEDGDQALLKSRRATLSIWQSAAKELATVTEHDPDQRKTAVETLLKIAASGDLSAQMSAANALAVITLPIQLQRRRWSGRS